ncbi:GNAT family N-acetyltransferase [Actinomadura scrupuli]|uniref:GNAT family N-acetyltransferase n=1 Tax=Actinomadura scrupuli TaxID=559629 RepID=UPI003D95F9A9
MPAVDVRPLPAAASTDTAVMEQVTELVNRVYSAAEEGLWIAGAARTTVGEIAGLTRAGEIAVARLDGRIAGCVRVRRLDGGTGEFGMLAADPGHRGSGVGRELVRFAERTCREGGLSVMQLELLVPRAWAHPSKEFLAGWYTRIGYRVVRRGTIDESHPHLAPLLATPCDVVIYHKALDGSAVAGPDAS